MRTCGRKPASKSTCTRRERPAILDAKLMCIALVQLILRRVVSPVQGERRVPSDSSGRIGGNDAEPDANKLVSFMRRNCSAVRRFLLRFFAGQACFFAGQATFIRSSGCFPPRRVCAASCALRRVPCCSGASRVRFVFRVSSPFAIPTAHRWRSPKLRVPQRPRTQPRTRVNPAAARARMRARRAPRVTPAQPRGRQRPPTCPPRDRARHPRRPSRRHPASLPSHAWCGSGKQSTVRRSRGFHWAAATRPQRPRRRPTRPNRRKPRTPPPPAVMFRRPPHWRRLAFTRVPGRPLPTRRRRRRRCKRRFGLPALGATTSRAISSGVASGQMTGALAPPLRPAPTSAVPRRRKLSPEWARERVLSNRRRRRRFAMPALATMTRATIPSGVTTGRMIGARAAAVNDARNPIGRANAREAASSFRGFWEWSR